MRMTWNINTKVMGIEELSMAQIAAEVQQGARFVLFYYCVSVLIATFRHPSHIYFVRPGESAVRKGLRFSIVSLLLGWWGLPWGPIRTVGALITNCRGGQDVTQEVLANFRRQAA